ncbi:hypothetical protein HMPREF9120_01936 [Neisseria sp. oral taxon 020 str. F0370]|nr:hypothetical protein HMPREF9120_01936 [Neisseria sp. oral taxon 020 str. F0370]
MRLLLCGWVEKRRAVCVFAFHFVEAALSDGLFLCVHYRALRLGGKGCLRFL